MKTMRKILSMMLVLTLVVSLSVSVFAANPTVGTLTVHGNELGGKNVTAVLMFTANVKSDDDMIDKNDSIGYELVPAWQEFIDAQIGLEADANATSEEAYEYVKLLVNDALESFAEAAMKYAKDNNITARTEEADEVSDTATFDNLTAGYYVVYPEAGSTSVDRGTEAMLVNVPSANSQSLNIKSKYPTVEKKVGQDKEDVSAEIGDTVTFTLTSQVPEMSDYDHYAFYFVDRMSAGLTYEADSVVVTIGGETVTPSRVTYEDNVLRVEFDDLKIIDGAAAGEDIIVTYNATVNANAVVGANTNTAHVEYSNDPNQDGEGHKPQGTSDDDDADVYVAEIIIDKYTGETYDENATRLSGAVFSLKRSGEEEYIALVDKGNNVYRVATADDTTTVTQVTTDANGKIEIEGLAEGTYLLEEIAAPTGYNRLAEPVTIEITFVEATTEKEAHFTYRIGNEIDATESSTVPVENKTGAVLPETGAMGTIGLTIFGAMVVILGIALPRKKNARA